MKKLLTIFAVLYLCACQQVELTEKLTEQQQEYTKKFSFSVKGDFVNPEFTTKVNTNMQADGVEMKDMWVIDYKDGAIKQELHQSNDDADWGSPIMNLTLGTHHILFLASRGNDPQYREGVVTWFKPMDTFYCDYEVTVAKTSNGNRSVTLSRVATKLNLTINDAIPTGTNSIVFEPATWFTGWNMLTGKPVATNNYQLTTAVPDSWKETSGKSLTSWSLSTSEEWVTDLHYTSYAGNAVKNGEVTISDAPLVANRVTKYTGNFYSKAGLTSVSLLTEWLPDYEGEY